MKKLYPRYKKTFRQHLLSQLPINSTFYEEICIGATNPTIQSHSFDNQAEFCYIPLVLLFQRDGHDIFPL